MHITKAVIIIIEIEVLVEYRFIFIVTLKHTLFPHFGNHIERESHAILFNMQWILSITLYHIGCILYR